MRVSVLGHCRVATAGTEIRRRTAGCLLRFVEISICLFQQTKKLKFSKTYPDRLFEADMGTHDSRGSIQRGGPGVARSSPGKRPPTPSRLC